jgi:hypothetical protein
MIATDMQYSRHDSATLRPPRRRRARRAAVALILGALAMEIGERLLVAQP